MSKLIFDIETIGEDFDLLDKTTRESLNEEDILGFSPLTGSIVAIGVLDLDLDKGAVYYQSPDKKESDFEEDGIKFKTMSEKEMLEGFWEGARKYQQFISFNGRAFDAPFMMVRSAVHGIRPTVNLMPYRYANDTTHLDLLDQLSFYGSVRKKGGLHLWSRVFGIKSPKDAGITGEDVGQLFKDKRYLDIAKYNVGDLRATRELFQYWEKYFKF